MSKLQLAFVAMMIAACPLAADEPKQVILTTFQPLYSIAHAVAQGSPNLDVRNLAPRALGPHDYDSAEAAHREAFTTAVRGATAIVTLRSLALAPFFDDLYPQARAANIRIVEIDLAAPGPRGRSQLILVPNPMDTAHAADHDHDHAPAANPHLWLSLSHGAIMAQRMARDFAALDPPREALYRDNARAFGNRLLAMRAQALSRLAAVELPPVAAVTEGFPYFTADLGIPVAEYLLEGGPADVTRRLNAIGAKVVLAEEAPEAELDAAIRAGGGTAVVLSTLEEGWGEGESVSPDGYLAGMQANLGALLAALGAR